MKLLDQPSTTAPRVVDDSTKAGAIRSVAAVLGGVSALVLGRLAGSSVVGATGLASSWGVMAAGLTSAGLAPTLVRFGASLNSVGPQLRRLNRIGAIGAAVLAVLGLVTFDRGAASKLTMLLAATVGAFTVLGSVSGARLVLAGRLIRFALVSLVAAVMSGLAIGLTYLLNADRLTIATASALVGISVLTIGLAIDNSWEQRRGLVQGGPTTAAHSPVGPTPYGSDTGVDASDFRSFLRRSWLTNLFQMAVFRADALVLGAVAASAELGRYLLMLKAIEALAMVIQQRSTKVFGDTVFQDQHEAVAATTSNARIAIVMSLLLGVAGSVGFGALAPTLLGNTFAADRWWILVLAVPSLLLTASSIYLSYFAARGILRVGLRAGTVGLGVSLPAYLILVPAYGLRGACVASAVVYLSQAGYVYLAFRSHVRDLA